MDRIAGSFNLLCMFIAVNLPEGFSANNFRVSPTPIQKCAIPTEENLLLFGIFVITLVNLVKKSN